ncbi:MAG: protein-disulfide reductase DsbD family protein [Thermoguttaceae bacterium]
MKHRIRRTLLLLAVLLLFADRPAWGQLRLGLGGDTASKIQVTAQFTEGTGGSAGRLFVTATIEPDWHIYSITQKGEGPIASAIKLSENQGLKLLGPFQVYPAPDKKVEELFDNLLVETHRGRVVWHAPVEFAVGVDRKALKVKGALWAQACSDTACLPPQDYGFTAIAGRGEDVPAEQLEGRAPASAGPSAAERGSAAPAPPDDSTPPGTDVPDASTPKVAPPSGAQAEREPGKLKWHRFTTLEDFGAIVGTKGQAFHPEQVTSNLKAKQQDRTLEWVLLGAFAGGLILNLMPCVLPVIGLKVLSFVTQAGESRGRAFVLNVVYSSGIIAVFLVLAALAIGLGLGWGQLFTYGVFNVVMAAVVFAMGLSFLGVWEIPIPGFVGSGKSVRIQQQEGLLAAFLKGVITTVLATPCTGPFMASALTWAVAQPPAIVFAVFGAIGLGMSSPYLLIGTFPELIRFLPKPGAWMETFKQIMGFFLLGTVVFLFSFLDWPYVVPTLGLLFAIWAGLWWFNRTPVTAAAGEKWQAWLQATALVGVAWLLLFPGLDGIVPKSFGLLSFHGLYDEMEARFLARVGDGAPAGPIQLDEPRTVVVDFTADWCLTCKGLEAKVLNAPSVVEAFRRNEVVLLKADYTHRPPEVEQFLNVLGSKQVPILAFFSPDAPNSPIVFRDGYTQRMVLDALEKVRPRG